MFVAVNASLFSGNARNARNANRICIVRFVVVCCIMRWVDGSASVRILLTGGLLLLMLMLRSQESEV